jgi:hypothetical protein
MWRIANAILPRHSTAIVDSALVRRPLSKAALHGVVGR